MKDWTGNKHSVFATLGATNHTAHRRPSLDYYATDPVAVDLLLANPIAGRLFRTSVVWECACGDGSLSKALLRNGIKTYSSDIADRGFGQTGIDFLTKNTLIAPDVTAILTNPPYKYATEFVTHALDLLPNRGICAMFLKTTFLEGQSRYGRIFSHMPPCYVFQFVARVLCAKNGDFRGFTAAGGSAVSYAWFMWVKGSHDEPIIQWLPPTLAQPLQLSLFQDL